MEQLYSHIAEELQYLSAEVGRVQEQLEKMNSSNLVTAVIGALGVILGALVTSWFQFWGTRLAIRREESQRRQSAYDDVRNKVREARQIIQSTGVRWAPSRNDTGSIPIPKADYFRAINLIDTAQTEPLIHHEVREALESISGYNEDSDPSSDTVTVRADFFTRFDSVHAALEKYYPWTLNKRP